MLIVKCEINHMVSIMTDEEHELAIYISISASQTNGSYAEVIAKVMHACEKWLLREIADCQTHDALATVAKQVGTYKGILPGYDKLVAAGKKRREELK